MRSSLCAALIASTFVAFGMVACTGAVVPPTSVGDKEIRSLSGLRESKVLDSRATKACTISPTATTLIAAVDSTSGEVRRLKAAEKVADDYAEGLPKESSDYVAICIWQTPEDTQLQEKYLAVWTFNDGQFTRLISAFN